ncbi:MAG: ComEC/Rec2 family competence protein, partial [Fimbriimonadaceae bacterium]|nr:ComEC/Rec2 family competence protein [Chitinophagales bacterium]
NTGTMHILSVSGLHVGILFIILDWLMRFVPYFKINRPRNKLMKALLIVFIIWFYACITGLSPSVSRSAVMFSFLIFGRLGTRYVNSFNILACSAIPLLVVNPFMVTQVGFQLSYLAILGILTFQPPLSKLFVPNTLVGKYLWSLGTVSVGAQLGTVPVTILYFHQFPNYFLLSNILAIPISFVVLIAGIMFFALSFIPQINFITGWLLEFSMKALNYVVVLVDKIPGALADNLFITIPETILFYIILFFAGTFIFLKNKKYILYMTALTCLLFVSVGIRKYFHVQQEEVGIYSLPKSFAIAEIHGLQAKIYSPDSLNIESPDFTYHIQNDLISKGIKKYEFIRLEDMRSETLSYQNYFLIDTILFYTIDKKFEHPETAVVQVDYIIVMNNPYLKINEVKEYFPESALIFSSSNNYRSLNYWRNYCDEHATKYHDMKRDGYLSVRN